MQGNVNNTSRLAYFDLLRLTLVTLALLSHFLLLVDWEAAVSLDLFYTIRVVTRGSMPGLLIVFGFMMQYVYSRKWDSNGPRTVFSRLVYRMVLCYFAYLGIVCIGALGGYHSWKHAVASTTLLLPAMFAGLFKYYALLIPFVFLFLFISKVYGLRKLILTVIIWIVFVELARHHLHSPHRLLNHSFSLLFGIGNSWGPSISHAIIFVLFGMLLSEFLYGVEKRLAKISLIISICLSIALLGYEVFQVGGEEFASGIINTYRPSNHMAYFAFGILAFALFAILSYMVSTVYSHSFSTRISYLGANTFAIFFWGNVVLLLIPFKLLATYWSLSAICALFPIIIAASYYSPILIDNLQDKSAVFYPKLVITRISTYISNFLIKKVKRKTIYVK